MLELLTLIHPEADACAAFRDRFAGLPSVNVLQLRLDELPPHDCFVTAGNSFGLMTAGIDAAVVARFGEQVMARVQQQIMDEYYGEQPVGTAFVIPTDDADIPWLCHAPSMRVPGSIEGTDKIYCAAWAALLAVMRHNRNSSARIESVAMPAFGTGFGGVGYSEAARQMAAAYRHLLEPPHRLDWDFVAERGRAICYDGGRKVVG